MEYAKKPAISRQTALEELRLPPSATTEEILGILRRQGIAILPGFFSDQALTALNDEFDRVLERAQALEFNVTEREAATTVAIIRNRLPVGEFPAIAETFGLAIMAQVASAFYEGAKVALNHQIYANHNKGTAEAIPDLPFVPHLDKIQTLKFFIYLTDTYEENGAMGVVPGSQTVNHAHRMACLKANPDFRAVTNLVSDAATVPVEGPAGTMFIFETDVTHSAGYVAPGKERRILRGHTRTVAELEALRMENQAVGIEI